MVFQALIFCSFNLTWYGPVQKACTTSRLCSGAALCEHRCRSMSLGTIQKRGGMAAESQAEILQHGQGPTAHDSEGEATGTMFV